MLTDTKIKALRSKDKPFKIADGHGLYIYVTKHGAKYWRQKYRINGKEKLLSHGEYPFVTLQQARSLRDKAKEKIKSGEDPAIYKRIESIYLYQFKKAVNGSLFHLYSITVMRIYINRLI